MTLSEFDGASGDKLAGGIGLATQHNSMDQATRGIDQLRHTAFRTIISQDRMLSRKMVAQFGFEPKTPAYETGVLPGFTTAQFRESRAGFEPATSPQGLTGITSPRQQDPQILVDQVGVSPTSRLLEEPNPSLDDRPTNFKETGVSGIRTRSFRP